MLKDLEQIQHEVLDPQSRQLLAEVMKCYQAGAYRAALVCLWIAVVADLTGKIRYLAESGDGQAKSMIDQLDQALAGGAVKKVQDYERTILEKAEQTLEILLPRERKELERLKEDRNLCAHPGYLDQGKLFIPDAEAVRAHIVAASRAVFSQRPLAGKQLINLLEKEVKGRSWPAGGDYFLDRFFCTARSSVKKNMLKVLVKHSIRPAEDCNTLAQRSREATLAVAQQNPPLFEEVISSVLHHWEASGALGEAELLRAAGAYGAQTLFWQVLPATGKSRLKTLLARCDTAELLDQHFFVCGEPKDKELAQIFTDIVASLTDQELAKAIEQSKNRRPFVQQTISLVESSPSFRAAEANLRLVELCSENLTANHIKLLRKAIQANKYDQVRQAMHTEAILINIYFASSPNQAAHQQWQQLADWHYQQSNNQEDGLHPYQGLRTLIRAD